MQPLKSLTRRILRFGKVYPTPLTEKSKLIALVHKLHPIFPGVDLVRLGTIKDGGYLVPNDLEGIEACFSPGVDYNSEFEKDCADLGMQVFLADKSVAGPAASHERFIFTKKYIGATTSDDFITIDDWINSSLSGSQSDLLLQIDIEGYEYDTFLNITNNLMQRFRIIVAEFHNLDMLWSRPFFELASRAFEKILQSHICVHIHPNNCSRSVKHQGIEIPCVAEFTFLRKDRVTNPSLVKVFPHPLDSKNNGGPCSTLPKCWYIK